MSVRYLEPPDAAIKGRSLNSSDDYFKVSRQLMMGEVLVALLNNGTFKAAPYLTCQEEFNEFYFAYLDGRWYSIDFFAVGPRYYPFT